MFLGRWPRPFAFIICAANPPALARQPISFAHDQHREFRFTAHCPALINRIQNFTQRPHFGAREAVAEHLENFRIAQGLPACCRRLDKRLDAVDVKQRPTGRRQIIVKKFVYHLNLGGEPRQPLADNRFCLGHDPVDQFLATRNVID
jgi:hypothetical protein